MKLLLVDGPNIQEKLDSGSYEVQPFNVEALKANVATVLVTQYDYDLDEAEEAVNASHDADSSDWHENADANQLAEALADE